MAQLSIKRGGNVVKLIGMLVVFFVQVADVWSVEMPPAWPWHGVSIQNTEPFEPTSLEQITQRVRINSIQIRLMPRRVAEIQKISSEEAWKRSLSWGDAMLDQCKKLGLAATMTVEGGFPLDPSLPLMSNGKEFWNDPVRLNEAIQIADKLAAFFAKRGAELVAYQMLSEPLIYDGGKALSPTSWRDLIEKIIYTIRRRDPNRWIAVAPPPGGGPNLYKGFQPFSASRIIYGAHMYIPQAFTHQGILQWQAESYTYPGRIGGVGYWDKKGVEMIMSPLREFQQRYQVPVWIGEFGTVPWADGGEQYILDLVDIFDNWSWGWTYFSINGFYGWSPDYDNQKPQSLSEVPKHRVGASSLRWQTLRRATGVR